MGVVDLLGLLIGSFAILSASVSSQSSPLEYSAADGATPAQVLEVERLNEQTDNLKGKLEDVGVGVTVGEEVTGESATLEWTKEVTTENTSTALSVNAPAWELGGQTTFDISQAMGGWHFIEVFKSYGRPSPDECEEFILKLSRSRRTVEHTQRCGKSGDKYEARLDYKVDTQSPHQWTEGWFTWTMVTTNYANWAVLMECNNTDLSPCFRLLILSRERTLPPATLEMLRNVAEQRGFSKANGALVDQTSC